MNCVNHTDSQTHRRTDTPLEPLHGRKELSPSTVDDPEEWVRSYGPLMSATLSLIWEDANCQWWENAGDILT